MSQFNAGIQYLQRRLNAAGFGPLDPDGIWGGVTQTALDRALPFALHPSTVDPLLIAALKRDEGLRLEAYPDPLSPLAQALRLHPSMRPQAWATLSGAPWTIGYGHTGPEVRQGLVWTPAQADVALVADVVAHNRLLDDVLPWVAGLDDVRRRVLQNMHFNLGWDNPRTPKLEGLSGFVTTLAKVRAGDYAGAADGMGASLWARQTKSRADRLIREMRTGLAVAA